MHKMFLTFGAFGILVSCTTANAEMNWITSTRPYLEARSSEPESDASLRAICRSPASIEVRIGANEQVGKGHGEPVKLIFVGNGRQVIVRGISERSSDYEMTGGTELVADLLPGNKLFDLLISGQPVQMGGTLKNKATWSGDKMVSAVRSFLTACKGN
jgi:hypothetical protein